MTGPRTRPMMIEVFAAIALSLAATTAGLAAGADASPVAPPQGSVPSLALGPIPTRCPQASSQWVAA